MGRVLNNKYELLEKAGENEKVYIYKARELKSGSLVTVKILRKKWAKDKNLVERFNREVEVLAGLNHPNILKVLDVDYANDVYFVVTEFFEGERLFNIIELYPLITIPQAINITVQLARILEYALSQGVKFRNIRLSDIIVNRIGRIKIEGFATPRSLLTPSVAPTIKPQGIGPDIFFLGFVLYTLITNKFPFRTKKRISDIATISSYLEELQWELGDINLNHKEKSELSRIILKAVTRNVKERYQTIEKFLNDIDKFCEKFPHIMEVTPESDEVQEKLPSDNAKKLLLEAKAKKEDKLKFESSKKLRFEKYTDKSSQLIWAKSQAEESFLVRNLPGIIVILTIFLLIFLILYL